MKSGAKGPKLQGGLTAAKKRTVQRQLPPHLGTKTWLIYFHDVVLLELLTARINKGKTLHLRDVSHKCRDVSQAAVQIKHKLQGS